jgi:hypothetical protein
MIFYRVLARLAAQVLLGLAVFLWGVVALLDAERTELRPWFILGFVAALAALIGLSRGWRSSAVLGAFGLFFPIGVLAHGNGASPWLWLFWIACAAATERWIRDGIQPGLSADGRSQV